MNGIRQRVKEITSRSRCHADIRDVIADLNPVLRGWGNYFCTGNAARCYNQLDETRLADDFHSLRAKRTGRSLKPGQAERWRLMREYFWGLASSPPARTVHATRSSPSRRRPRSDLRPERPPVSRVRGIRTSPGLEKGALPSRRLTRSLKRASKVYQFGASRLEREFAQGPARAGRFVAGAGPARRAADAGDEAHRRRLSRRLLRRLGYQLRPSRRGPMERGGHRQPLAHRGRGHQLRPAAAGRRARPTPATTSRWPRRA